MANIVVEDVSVDFPLYHGNARSLKKMVLSAASGRVSADRQNRVVVQALRNITFTLNPGDRLALVGGNGAGKTTLLRTLAGIFEPVGGRLKVTGLVGSLLDPTLGMNAELSGRENIMLRGLYNGMSKAEIDVMADDVAEFAELGEFLELPVRFYSSGMNIRLAFAMATAIKPQILLMDEWFLAGDAAFMDKARPIGNIGAQGGNPGAVVPSGEHRHRVGDAGDLAGSRPDSRGWASRRSVGSLFGA